MTEDEVDQIYDTYELNVGPTTATSPPKVTPTNINLACEKKKEVVQSLPTRKCVHCGTEMTAEGSFVQNRDGDIMGYCRNKGGCGRSQLLFRQPTLSTPTYVQVCKFELNPSKRGTEDPGEFDLVMKEYPAINGNAECLKCGKQYKTHRKDADNSGWVVGKEEPIVLPKDWPTWDAKTKSWK